jgi:DNA-binding response OmpR family regulator
LMRVAFAVSDRRPRAAEAATAVATAAAGSGLAVAPRPARKTPTVVLADDDAIVQTLTLSLLQNHGMSCRSVDNGLDALRVIRSEQPDIALLDVNMPGMRGFEVLAAVRAENLPTRVILLSALQQEDDILLAFRLGADDYLVKPFNVFELVARLKRFVR